ncbi:MAG TPA: VWA domain-containing protein [Bacteroidia bacterium]|nr:VWA domain-containing protein [Bacteroidia bacterium]HNU34054.1 VWA domain-containing protein [Bacteroidia bacterium]
MRKFLSILFILCLCTSLRGTNRTKLEVVFCIDMSGSTNGVIEDFRNNYWQLIKNINTSTNGSVRIGIIGYARPSFGATSSYIKIFSDLTEDFEALSYSINQLKINIEKGDQFIPAVIYTATLGLNWSEDEKTKKIVFLVGNGKVQTGKFDFRKACDIAKEKNVIIYPVNCLQKTVAPVDAGLWKAIATQTGGEFESISVSAKERVYSIAGIHADVADFNKKLASTFIYYGGDGLKRFMMMNQTDTFCMRISPREFYARCNMKLSDNYYKNACSWDLVSQAKISQPDFNSINRKFLPDSLQNLDVKKLASIINTKSQERNYILVQLKNSLQRAGVQQTNYETQLDSILNTTIKKVVL